MTTLFGDIDGEGCDTATEGTATALVEERPASNRHRPGREKVERDESEVEPDRGPWNLTHCFWLLNPGPLGISTALAAQYHDTGERVIVFGTVEDAEAVAAGMEKETA